MKLPITILLVDDDETSLFLNKRVLERLEIAVAVLTAGNGQEALDIMYQLSGQDQCPEVILLDTQMPIMNGFEFLEQFQKVAHLHSPSLKIALLSSLMHPLDIDKAKKYPEINFIEKPLTREKLLKIL